MFGTYFSATIFLPESGLPVLARLDATSQAPNAEQAGLKATETPLSPGLWTVAHQPWGVKAHIDKGPAKA
jgi:hypothetical protein